MTAAPRQTDLLFLLFWSLFLFAGGIVLDQTFRWTDPGMGFLVGVYFAIPLTLVWLVYGLVPGLLVGALYYWRGWRRFRTVAVIFPGLAAVDLFVHPNTPADRLKEYTGAEFPASAREVRTFFTGGPINRHDDTYYFRCRREETEALIQALKLTATEDRILAERPFPDWPDPSGWVDSAAFEGRGEGKWRYYLRTDAKREEVYLRVSSI